MQLPQQSGPTDLSSYDGVGQAELVRTGQVSPLELVDDAIARIERQNPEINAVISNRFERARAEAAGATVVRAVRLEAEHQQEVRRREKLRRRPLIALCSTGRAARHDGDVLIFFHRLKGHRSPSRNKS